MARNCRGRYSRRSYPDNRLSVQELFFIALGINAAAFWLMGWDKARSQESGRRIPERVFLLAALCLGAAGIWLGMAVFRHKTKTMLFQLGIPALFLANLAIAYFGYRLLADTL